MQNKTGLWALDRNLVVDPRSAVFPKICLFTGDKVASLTPMTLAQVEAHSAGPFKVAGKKTIQLQMPVSVQYRRNRASWAKKMRLILVLGGITTIALGIAIPLLLGLTGEALATPITLSLAAGILAILVGAFFPYLDDMNGSRYMSGVKFMKDGRVLIPNVHESVLSGLPKLKRGFVGGTVPAAKQ